MYAKLIEKKLYNDTLYQRFEIHGSTRQLGEILVVVPPFQHFQPFFIGSGFKCNLQGIKARFADAYWLDRFRRIGRLHVGDAIPIIY